MITLQSLFQGYEGYYSNVRRLCFFSMEDIFFMIFSTNSTFSFIFISGFQTVCLSYFYLNHCLLISKHHSFNNFNSHNQFASHIIIQFFGYYKILLYQTVRKYINYYLSIKHHEQKDCSCTRNNSISDKSHYQLSILRTSISSRS